MAAAGAKVGWITGWLVGRREAWGESSCSRAASAAVHASTLLSPPAGITAAARLQRPEQASVTQVGACLSPQACSRETTPQVSNTLIRYTVLRQHTGIKRRKLKLLRNAAMLLVCCLAPQSVNNWMKTAQFIHVFVQQFMNTYVKA